MNKIKEVDNYSIITDYDDGVVCFGKVTQSQIERQKRLPRHTVLPSDIQLSESFLNSNEDDEDDGNDETLSEDQNKFAFTEDRVEDEVVSYVDVQEEELSINNFIDNETNSCSPTVSNIIEQSMNDHKISDSAINVCTLKHSSQLKDEDISYYCDSELGELENFDEYSIVPDEFTITPGKQRLFDTRLAKSLIHAENFEISQAKSISNIPGVFNNSSEFGKDKNTSNVSEKSVYNKKSMNNTSDIIVSTADINDYNNEEESDAKKVSVKCNAGAVDNILDETMCTSLLFPSDKSKVFDNSSNEIGQDENTSNVSEESLYNKKSMNNTSDIIVSSADVNGCNEEESNTMEVDIKHNAGVVDNIIDETMCTSLLFLNDKSKVLDNSSNEIGNDENTSNVVEKSSDNKKSMNTMSHIIAPTADANNFNNEEESDAKKVSVKCNAGAVDNILDETMCTSLLFPSDKSKVFDNSSNEIGQDENTSNVSEESLYNKKSMNNTSDIIVSSADVNGCNEEESNTMEVDIKHNAGVVDNIIDETMCTSLLFLNDKSKVLDNSSNEIGNDENTSNVVEKSSDNKKSMNTMSHIIAPTADANNFNNEEESDAKKVSVKCNAGAVDNILDETMCTSLLFPSDKSKVFDNSSNEIGQDENTSNVSEESLYNKKSMNNTSDIIVSSADVNGCNEEESNTMEVDIKHNAGVVDNIIDETMCTSLLFLNDKSKVLDNSSNEIGNDENTSNVVEKSSDNKESMNTMSHIIAPTADANNFNNEEESDAKKVSVKCNAGAVDNILDETMCTSLLFPSDKSKVFDNSSNEIGQDENTSNVSEESLYNKKSMNNTSDIIVSSADVNGCNEEESNTMEVDIKHNAGVVDNIIDETMCTSLLFLNDKSKVLDNSSNEIGNDENTSNVVEKSSDNKKSMNTMSHIIAPTADANNFNNEEESDAKKVSVKCNAGAVDNILDETMCTSLLFPSDKSKVFDNSSNEIGLDENTSNVSEKSLTRNDKKSMNTMCHIIAPIADVNDYNNEEESDIQYTLKSENIDKSSFNLEQNTLLNNVDPQVDVLITDQDNNNPSNHCDLSCNQTITDTNLNLSTNPITVNDFKRDIDGKTTEETTSNSSNKDVGSGLLVDEQLVTDESSNHILKIVEQANLELFNKNESKQNNFCNKSSINDTTGVQYQSACSLNNTLNQSIMKSDFTGITTDQNKQLTVNSYPFAIKDFSIIEQQTVTSPQSKTDINNLPVESHWNVSNLIEMSVVSKIDSKSNDHTIVTSDNSFVAVPSNKKSEKSFTSSLDEKNNSAINIEKPMFSYNSEILTDVQMNDVTLIESAKKSLIEESSDSNESNQQKGNKRKLDLDQEQQSYEKKMKIETNNPKTPISMLYKFRNMYKSSEKLLIHTSNSKENDLKSDKCHQKLNFSSVEKNKNELRTEVLVKSKIPCKINDKSMSKNCEFNNSSLSLNDSIKQKRTIPRLIGTPVLSDLSNSSKRKCLKSRIPSSLKK